MEQLNPRSVQSRRTNPAVPIPLFQSPSGLDFSRTEDSYSTFLPNYRTWQASGLHSKPSSQRDATEAA